MRSLAVVLLALFAVLFVVAVTRAEPPQCNLPGWGAITKTTTTFRNPVGHTHTCAKCGTTWDHSANPTHKCQNCGQTQFNVDRSPRKVTVRTVQLANLPVEQPVIQATPQSVFVIRSIKAANCPNGNCPYAR